MVLVDPVLEGRLSQNPLAGPFGDAIPVSVEIDFYRLMDAKDNFQSYARLSNARPFLLFKASYAVSRLILIV